MRSMLTAACWACVWGQTSGQHTPAEAGDGAEVEAWAAIKMEEAAAAGARQEHREVAALLAEPL